MLPPWRSRRGPRQPSEMWGGSRGVGHGGYLLSGAALGRLGRAPEPAARFRVLPRLFWRMLRAGEGKEFLCPGTSCREGAGCHRVPPPNQGSFPPGRWQSYESPSARSFVSNIKRHSEGTFTSDFTRYLDKMKAKDFVHWLINTKRVR